MNVFDTEHPLNSRTARANFRHTRLYSFFRAWLIVTLGFLPLLAAFLWYLNITDIETTDFEPDPFWMVVAAAAIGSFLVSFLVVSLFCLVRWFFRLCFPAPVQVVD